MRTHPLLGRTSGGATVLVGEAPDEAGRPRRLRASLNRTMKLLIAGLLCVLLALLGLVFAVRLRGLLTDRPEEALSLGPSAIPYLVALACLFLGAWLLFFQRVFERRPDGFVVRTRPFGLRSRVFRWTEIEWLGVRSVRVDHGVRRTLMLKRRSARRPVRLLSVGDVHPVAGLIMDWGGDRWRAEPASHPYATKYRNVAPELGAGAAAPPRCGEAARPPRDLDLA